MLRTQAQRGQTSPLDIAFGYRMLFRTTQGAV